MLRLVCMIAFIAIFVKFVLIPIHLVLFLASTLYLATGGWRWLKLLSKTFKRDVSGLIIAVRMIYPMVKIWATKKSLGDMLDDNVKKSPNKMAFVDGDTLKTLTFKEAQEVCHKIANVFYEAGYRKGDVVALYMENRIEYMLIWLGLSMIGVITSLINYNLREDSLKHCVEVCKCKAIIFSDVTKEAIKEIQGELKVQLYCFDALEITDEPWKLLNELIDSSSCLPPPRPTEMKLTDTLLYMYTSGTTGLPKAVIWSSVRNIGGAVSFPLFFGFRKNDVLYVPLPLYHGSGMVFTSCSFLNGATTIIKKKFSASRYMEDCCKFNVTVIIYIGEVCRYVLSQPKTIFDEINSIRVAIGNGLRASIWTEFKDRFKIENIVEFYGATEGNTVLIPNGEGRVGAVGYRSLLFPNNDLKLVKMDGETGEILRDVNGLALEAEIGEPGQAVGKITERTRFDGYTNKDDTKKKITHNIFKQGDSAYISGDILTRDDEGYYYFKDRIGDTFRWKGENVSTNEVEGLISKVMLLNDVCVYGVEVPGNEGRAGMACIMDPEKKIDIEDLPKALDKVLPKYAQPQFLRLSSIVDLTGTFKFQKNRLKKESYVPDACGSQDVLYYFNKKEKKYFLLDDNAYLGITSKTIQF